jgi:putative thioredoxin
MTDPNITPRGVVDLAALAAQSRRAEQGVPQGAVDVTEATLQELALRSREVPVLIAFVSAASPASNDLAARLAAIAAEEGLPVGICDVDAQPAIAQALQVAAVPAVMALLGGRPAPLFQGSAPDEQLRDVVRQVVDAARQSGIQVGAEPPTDAPAEPQPEPLPPLHQEAYDAIEREDYDGAINAFDRALKENPKDADARAGRSQVRLMARMHNVDMAAVRAAAAADPANVDAQLAVADLDVMGGQVEDAFSRLIDLVRVSAGEERDRTRERLVELFDVVGDDPRVTSARRALAAALY